VAKRTRVHTREIQPSPKLWADAWLLSFADQADGVIVTFDRALARRRSNSILLK